MQELESGSNSKLRMRKAGPSGAGLFFGRVFSYNISHEANKTIF